MAAVVEVCRRLDGIPLAIELAAARVGALTPAEIAGPRAAAVLAGALETTLAPLRFPYIAGRGSGLAVRTADLARARQELGDSGYEQARAEGVAMSREDALAFALQHL